MQPPSGRSDAKWEARPRLATLLRVVATVGPMVVGAVVVLVVSHALPSPDGWLPTLGWWIGLTVVSTLVVTVTERGFRRFLPLVALFRLSLVFPDHAPSRFKVAMRTNTLRQLQRSLADGDLSGLSAGLQESAEQLVALAGQLNAHDRMTRGHTERVRAYSLMIGEELKLPQEDLDKLHWAGLVHDIGKLEVPPSILNKAGRPSEEEWQILKAHPEAGLRLVEPLRPWLGEWADAASQHHERVDGKGYPFGLRGSEISLSGRIVAVADAYDVMTSVRSYKKAMTPAAARAELGRCAGTQFDRDVVRAFLNISVGKLRLVMGPLSSLAQLPRLADVPLGGAAASGLSTLSSVGLAVFGGLLGGALVPATTPTELAFAEPPPATSAPARPATSRAPVASLPADPEPTTAPTTTVVAATDATDATDAVTDGGPPPTAPPLRLTGPEDEALVLDPTVLGDPAPSSLRVTDVPDHLRAGRSGRRTTLAPDRDHHGTSTGRYEACWADACSSASLTVVVTAVNDAPVAVDDALRTDEDTALSFDPTRNDIDVEDGRPRLLSVDATTLRPDRSAAASITPDGEIAFAPPANFDGTATIAYTVVDAGGATATATASVVVGAVNDAPSAVADDVSATTGIPMTVNVLVNDTDPEGDDLELVDVGTPSIGRATLAGRSVEYTAPVASSGVATFTYTVRDTSGATATGSVVVRLVSATAPAAADDTALVTEDSAPAFLDVIDNDTGGTAGLAGVTVRVVDAPTRGTAAVSGVQVVYEPDGDLNGPDSLDYEICDAFELCDTATLTIDVLAVNDAPTFASSGGRTVSEDAGASTFTGWASSISSGPVDEASQAVTFEVTADHPELFVTQPTISDSGTLAFEAAPDANGVVSVRVVAHDDGGTLLGGTDASTPMTFTLTITAVNDPVVAGADAVTLVEDDPAVDLDVLANDTDADGDTLTVASFSTAGLVGGAVTDLGGGRFSYLADADFHGVDTFTYVVEDGHGSTATGSVQFTVTSAPDAPQARADGYTVDADGVLVVAAEGVLANDFDVDGDALAVSATPTAAPTNGTLSLGADGSFTYTPTPAFVGSDSFTYEIDDGTGRRATATVDIVVDSALTTSGLYLGTTDTGLLWDMRPTPRPTATPEPDHDADGEPGFSVRKSANNPADLTAATNIGFAHQVVGNALQLNGPVSLELWSTAEYFDADPDAHPLITLYDCLGTTTACTMLASTDVELDPYNGNVADWVLRTFTLGNVQHTIVPGHSLVVRVQVRSEDLWIAASGARPSRLVLTEVNAAPVAVDDVVPAMLEDGPTANLDVLANDGDSNPDPGSVTITSAPAKGTATVLADGTIDYTPSADANGADSFTYEVCDTDGLCDTADVSLTVTAVNDRPSFTGGGDLTVLLGATYNAVWATGTAGPLDEAAQTLTYTVTSDNPALFAVQPTINAAGVLNFRCGLLSIGTATVTLTLRDSGGTSNGGLDTSTSRTFVVTAV